MDQGSNRGKPDIDALRPLAVFAAVAGAGSFRAAALDLGISASLASQTVSAFEKSLGTQLIYRSTRKLTLTDAGSRLFEQAQRGLGLLGEAIAEAKAEAAGPTGSLKITAPTILASAAFAKFLVRYRKMHPAVALEIDLSDEHREPIADRIDLAIRIGAPPEGERVVRRLFETRAIVCGGPGGPRGVAHPQDLEEELFIHPPEVPPRFTLHRGPASCEVQARNHLRVNNGTLVRSLLAAGAGYALFPEFTVREAMAQGALVHLLPAWSTAPVPVSAVFTARRAQLSPARHFCDALVAFLAQRDPSAGSRAA